nr:immunoglobulin light chain junction region [Macaca mulatta]
CQHQIGSPRTF